MKLLLALFPLLVLAQSPPDTAKTRMEAARTELGAGHYPDAIRLANQAATAYRAVGDAKNAGNAITISGLAHPWAAEYDLAMRDMELALAIARQTGDPAQEVTRLNNLGNIFYFQGKYAEGLARLRAAMALVGANPAEPWNSSRRQLTTANIAVVYQRLGQNQLALDAYLELRQKHGNLTLPEQAQLLNNIGALYRRLGDPLKALDVYRESQALYRKQALRNGEISAAINIGIALALDLHRYPEALAAFSQAQLISHAAGEKVQELQAILYRAESLYRMGNQKEAEAGFSAAANAAETLKAGEEHWKALYGLARSNPANAFEKLQQATHLIETIRGSGPAGLRAGFLADKRQVYDLLIERLARSPNPDPTAILRAMEASRSRLIQDQRPFNPDGVKPAPGKTLLEYWVGENAVAIVAISSTARQVWFREMPGIRRRLKALQAKLSDPAATDWKNHELAAELVPVTGDLIIVPDRELALIPFEALLGDFRTISYLPSAALLTTATRERKIAPFWQRTLFALADPASGTGKNQGLGLATGERRQRLPSATKEAEGAADLLGGRTEVISGEAATKSAFTRGVKRGYPLLHLATHAYSDPDDGQRSWILLAGDQTADYDYLFPAEVASLNLKDIDLAVLSACETDAGRLTEGEGPATFARIMLAAGSHSVVASLWKADDAATAQLMKLFYRELSDGIPAAEALARAKRELAKSRPHPYYWAAFVLSGDGNTRTPLIIRWTWVAAGVLAVAGIVLKLRNKRA